MRNPYENVAYGGMDVHYKFSNVTWRDVMGKVVMRERLDHRDRPRLRERLASWPKGVPIVMEASFGWGWLSDEMEAAGLDPRLSNCFKVEHMRQARGDVKTNQKDADLLSLLPLEVTAWWEVWRAPPEVRDHREWMRYRAGLVATQTETKNRIHAVCHRHGIFYDFKDLFGGRGRRFLKGVCQAGKYPGGVLAEGALEGLRGLVRVLEELRAELATVAWRLRGRLTRDALTRRLDRIAGFGLILSHTVQAEVGRIERFRHQRALASYACLAPRANETGASKPGQAPIGRRLGSRGNRVLKWAFLEAARGAVRHGGKWRALWDRATEGGTKNKNRGYIKVARALVKVVYAVWSKGVEYQEEAPPRPGRPTRGRRRPGDSRPGTGQPSEAMVHAKA